MRQLKFPKEEEALQILIKAGWHEGRQVSLDEFIVKLLQEGYELFPTAKEFLKEFGYLEVRYPFSPQYNCEPFSIFPHHIFLEKTEPQLQAYERAAGVPLCAIGCSYEGHGLLMIGTNGLLYGGFGEYFWQESGEGLSALIAMIRNEPPIWKTEVRYEDF
jgi:hypothetical protein